jgi:nitrate reductase gamma subunit
MSFEYFMVGFGWLAAMLFVSVSGYRIIRIARLPLNVRWEVYPVPHEAKEKRHYGGSYMEEVGWAASKRSASPLPAYLEIATEVTTLQRVREHNIYRLWPLSLAMHWGLYLYFGWLFLLAAGNFFHLAALYALTTAVGLAAFILGAGGALGLMLKRATNRYLHRYTTPLDYFNLLFLAAFFLAALWSWFSDTTFTAHRAYIGSALCFGPAHVPPAVAVSFLLFELFMIYMPFTKLIHYFAKYFTFDRALWDDDFKAKSSATDQKVTAQLALNPDWAAPHITPGQTWLQQAQGTALPDAKK